MNQEQNATSTQVVYQCSIDIATDWGRVQVHNPNASISLNDNTSGATILGNTLQWGKQWSYVFGGVSIPFKVTLTKPSKNLHVSTLHGNDAAYKGDGKGSMSFYIGNNLPIINVDNTNPLNRQDYTIDLAQTAPAI